MGLEVTTLVPTLNSLIVVARRVERLEQVAKETPIPNRTSIRSRLGRKMVRFFIF